MNRRLIGLDRNSVRPQRADDLSNGRHSGLFEQAGQLIEEVLGGGRIVERRGADLDGRGARDEELEGVGGRGDPADADDGKPGRARATSQTMRRAIGLMAGPLRPPMSLARIGRRRRQSTAMPWMVLIRLTASAPASAAAAAIGTMSVTFGVSLAMIGSGQARRGPAGPAGRPRWRRCPGPGRGSRWDRRC